MPLRAVGSQELRFMHSTCLRRIHGRKLGSILPFIKGKMPPKPTGEKRTAFCPSPIQNSTPKNYNRSEPELRNLLAGHSAVPTAIAASLPWSASLPLLRTLSTEYGAMHSSASAPPLDPFGISGYGAHRGRWKFYTDLSRRDVRFAQRKDRTGFELDRRPQHLRDSTVAPPLPFPVHALWICGGKWGGENGPAEHCIKGALRVTRSSPKILGDLK